MYLSSYYDVQVTSGDQYTYYVTAVDANGVESPASKKVKPSRLFPNRKMIEPCFSPENRPNPLLALAGYKEARNQKERGRTRRDAILCNAAHAWGQTLQHVILAPNQITSMSVSSDPEFSMGMDPNDACYSDPIYKNCLIDAGSILNGTNADETLGACYYANLANIEKGGWFERCIVNDPARHPLLIKIKDHSFFR